MRLFLLIAFACLALASRFELKARASASLTIHIHSLDDWCIMAPINRQTIGDAESSSALKAYCTKPVDSQGYIQPSFFTHAVIDNSPGASGSSQIQMTGCIDVNSFDRLVPNDEGGQMDSSGGYDGRGMPSGSICADYAHYVELIEPAQRRACIRCCDDPNDCTLADDTAGCPTVVPNGDYSGCS